MNTMQTPDAKQWVERWKRLRPILEKIESEELRDVDAQEAIRKIMPMCDWCVEHTEQRRTSGLIEQQRYFTKVRAGAE